MIRIASNSANEILETKDNPMYNTSTMKVSYSFCLTKMCYGHIVVSLHLLFNFPLPNLCLKSFIFKKFDEIDRKNFERTKKFEEFFSTGSQIWVKPEMVLNLS